MGWNRFVHVCFAPDDAGGGAPEGGEQQQVKTFTQDEVDRIVGERLSKERKKMEKDVESKIAEAKTEAERLAAMSADEKVAHEKEQQEKARKAREEALTKREAAIQLRELRAEALETLAEKALPKALADCLDYSSADACKASIDSIGKVFNTAVQAEVEKRLQGHTPMQTGGSTPVSRAKQLAAQYNEQKYGVRSDKK